MMMMMTMMMMMMMMIPCGVDDLGDDSSEIRDNDLCGVILLIINNSEFIIFVFLIPILILFFTNINIQIQLKLKYIIIEIFQY